MSTIYVKLYDQDGIDALENDLIEFERLSIFDSTVNDQKIELIMENIEKFTLEQLEDFIKLHSK